MINLKEHFRLSAVYTFVAAFPPMLQLIVYPLIEGENRLGAVDFGYLAITEAIISVVFIICTFGSSSGLVRFYYDHRDNRDSYNKLVSTVLSGILGRGLLLLGTVLLFAPFFGRFFPQPDLQDFGTYGPSLVVSGLNRSVITAMLALYRNEKRLGLFIIVSISSGLLRSVFQLAGVFLYDMSFTGYVHGTAIGGSVLALSVVIYSYYKCGFHFDRAILGSLIPFTRPLFFTDLIIWGLLFADRFFLLSDPGNLGIYDNAMKFAIGMQLIINGLTNAIQPEIFRYLKEGVRLREKEIKTLANLYMAESITVISAAIVPVMLFISIFYETDLNLSSGLVSIVFVRFILTSQYQIFAFPVMFAKKTAIFFYVNSGVLIINLAINYLLTPLWGYYGAITAFLSASVFQVVLFSYIQNRIIPIKWNRFKVLYFPLALVLTAILLEYVKVLSGAEPFITAVLFVFLSFGGLLLLYRRELSEFIITLYKN